jgi:hypothetical protein
MLPDDLDAQRNRAALTGVFVVLIVTVAVFALIAVNERLHSGIGEPATTTPAKPTTTTTLLTVDMPGNAEVHAACDRTGALVYVSGDGPDAPVDVIPAALVPPGVCRAPGRG